MINNLKNSWKYILGIFVTLAFLYISETFFNDYTIRILNNVAIFIILSISYNLINGVTGEFSLESNEFVAIGAYIIAICLFGEDVKWDLCEL